MINTPEQPVPSPRRSRKRRIALLLALLLPICAVSVAGTLVLNRTNGHFFDSNGVTLHYTDEGEGVPVILLHGFGIQADWNWRLPRIVQRLSREFRVITLDVRGHGLSDKPHAPEDYGLELVHDVARLMDHLELDKAHVGGYSMGGFITLRFLSLYPERLYSAAICGAGWDELTPENEKLIRSIAEAIEQHSRFDPLVATLEPNGEPSFLKFAAVNTAMSLFNDTDAIVNIFRTFRELAVPEEMLAVNTVPTLGIVGTEDPLHEQTRRLAQIKPNVQECYIENRDHATTIVSREFYRTLADFFREHSPESPLQAQ